MRGLFITLIATLSAACGPQQAKSPSSPMPTASPTVDLARPLIVRAMRPACVDRAELALARQGAPSASCTNYVAEMRAWAVPGTSDGDVVQVRVAFDNGDYQDVWVPVQALQNAPNH